MKLSKSILIILSLTVVAPLIAQKKSEAISTPPIEIGSATKGRVSIQQGSLLGAKSFQMSFTELGVTKVTLYGPQDELIGTAEIHESLPSHTLFIRYTDSFGEAWLRTTMKRSANDVTVDATTSSGREIRLFAETHDAVVVPGKIRITSISIPTAGGVTPLQLGERPSVEQRLGVQRALQQLDDEVFDTPQLQKLRAFTAGLGKLRDSAVKAWTRVPSANGCPQSPSQSTIQSLGGDPEIEPVGQCSGTAYCTRWSTLIPVFNCVGGSGCTGMYIVYDYAFSLFFETTCSYLNNCA